MLRFRVCLLCIIYEGKRKKKHNRNRNARHSSPLPATSENVVPFTPCSDHTPFKEKKRRERRKAKGENETASQTFRRRPQEDHHRPGTTEKKKGKCIGAEHTTHPYPTTLGRGPQKGKRGKQRGESDLPKKDPCSTTQRLEP